MEAINKLSVQFFGYFGPLPLQRNYSLIRLTQLCGHWTNPPSKCQRGLWMSTCWNGQNKSSR